jgi:hypothetical protein
MAESPGAISERSCIGRRLNPESSDLTVTGTHAPQTYLICSTKASSGVP